MTTLERLKLATGESGNERDALLAMLLEDAREWMAAYTGRADWAADLPFALRGIQVRLAVMLFNRLGIEGMSAADEGGVKRTIETAPQEIIRALNPYRAAKVSSPHREANQWGRNQEAAQSGVKRRDNAATGR